MIEAQGASALALLSATSFGSADFLGGLATRRGGLLVTALTAQLAGCLVLAVTTIVWQAGATWPDLWWGAVAGVADCAGLLLLFFALSVGQMAGVAPVSGIVSSALPVVAGVLFGERPAVLQWVGIVLGLAAIAAISWPGPSATAAEQRRRLVPLLLGAAAGASFATYYILFSRISAESGVAPVLSARIASAVVVVVWIGWLLHRRTDGSVRERLSAHPGQLTLAAASGVLASGGNLLFVLAVREGQLGPVAVLASLYPAVTVVLALVVLRERPRAWHFAGIGAAVVAVGMIAAG